jgi:hypothetical protein
VKARTARREDPAAGGPLTRAFRRHLLSVMQFDARNPEVQTRYNEALRAGRPGPASSFSGNEANPYFRNGGGTFEEIGSTLGLSRLEDGRGLAIVDLDGDGAQDVVLHNFYRNPVVALLNRSAPGTTWLRLRLRGTASNRFGIGARVEVAGRVQELSCGMGYQSGNAPELHFGLGAAASADVKIRWPSGAVQTLPGLAGNRIHTIVEGEAAVRSDAPTPVAVEPDPAPPKLRVPGEPKGIAPPPPEGPKLVIAFSVDCLSCIEELRRMDEIEREGRALGLEVTWAGLDDPKRVEEEFARNGARSRPSFLAGPLPTPTVWLIRGGRSEAFTGRHAVTAALETAARPR